MPRVHTVLRVCSRVQFITNSHKLKQKLFGSIELESPVSTPPDGGWGRAFSFHGIRAVCTVHRPGDRGRGDLRSKNTRARTGTRRNDSGHGQRDTPPSSRRHRAVFAFLETCASKKAVCSSLLYVPAPVNSSTHTHNSVLERARPRPGSLQNHERGLSAAGKETPLSAPPVRACAPAIDRRLLSGRRRGACTGRR